MKAIPFTLGTVQRLMSCRNYSNCVFCCTIGVNRSDNVVLGCCGFHGDVLMLTKNITARMKVCVCMYVYDMRQHCQLILHVSLLISWIDTLVRARPS